MLYKQEPLGFKQDFEVCGCFILHKEEALFLQRNMQKSYGGKYGIPGGKKDDDESHEQCVIRETLEETGLHIGPTFLKTVYVYQDNNNIAYHMYKTNISEKVNILLNPNEHIGYSWKAINTAGELDLIEDMEECIKICGNTLHL